MDAKLDGKYFRDKAELCLRIADGLSLNNPGRFQLFGPILDRDRFPQFLGAADLPAGPKPLPFPPTVFFVAVFSLELPCGGTQPHSARIPRLSAWVSPANLKIRISLMRR
jgi:hypothetical protein